MIKMWAIPVILLAAFVVATPAAGQDPTGACWRLDDEYAGCVAGLTQSECVQLYYWTDPVWNGGSDCNGIDLPFVWDGSCFQDTLTIGERCVLRWSDSGAQYTSVEHCEEESGTWFDNLTCTGVPVPAMPRPGSAVMAFVLLAVTLAGLAARVS